MAVHFFSEIGAAQIVVRKVARFVTPRICGLLKPGNRFIKPSLLDKIRADVVVRIAELRVNLYGPLALSDGVVNAPLEMIRPAQKRVRFGGGMQIERGLIQLDGAVVIAFHLRLISVL